ncbi:PPO candidate 1 [Rubrivivax sp. A210]|uniref:thioredoxin family protein n=1 Tax=Rubrivivax sp. A210 TaxID=2772301 RepID=UPI00191810B0|nr:thioredoxin family protein [Rubrivivax sp. A210]CAD5370165.1 PPO candidate 1 [Rubrivivax sp. A210]
MKTLIAATVLAVAFAQGSGARAAAAVGQPAPAFSAVDTTGKTVQLSDFKGRHVVLEWVNPECPFVDKHYGAANMQATQKDATSQGVVWLAINSTTPEHGDYKKPAEMAQWMKAQKAAASATLMDSDGRIGRAYGARTTPHMYIVDPQGKLVYAGGIDNRPTADPADIPGATNHVKLALAEALAGKTISQAATRPYGCSVKYSNL